MDPRPTLIDRLTPLFIGVALVFLSAAPLGGWIDIVTAPNAMLVVFALWCLRREEALSPVVVFLCAVFGELVHDGPVGAQTMALLAATEALRTDPETRRFRPFWIEWSFVALAAAAVEIGVWAMLTATLAPAPSLSALVERVVATIVLYPIVAAAAHWIFGFGDRRGGAGDPAR